MIEPVEHGIGEIHRCPALNLPKEMALRATTRRNILLGPPISRASAETRPRLALAITAEK